MPTKTKVVYEDRRVDRVFLREVNFRARQIRAAVTITFPSTKGRTYLNEAFKNLKQETSETCRLVHDPDCLGDENGVFEIARLMCCRIAVLSGIITGLNALHVYPIRKDDVRAADNSTLQRLAVRQVAYIKALFEALENKRLPYLATHDMPNQDKAA